MPPHDSGNYEVVVSNDFGSFSKQITLNVFSPTAVKMVVGLIIMPCIWTPWDFLMDWEIMIPEIGSVVNCDLNSFLLFS